MRYSGYVVCCSQKVSVPVDKLPKHQICLVLLENAQNLFYVLLLRKCVPSACVVFSILISFPKIVLLLNKSDFHMFYKAHCC